MYRPRCLGSTPKAERDFLVVLGQVHTEKSVTPLHQIYITLLCPRSFSIKYRHKLKKTKHLYTMPSQFDIAKQYPQRGKMRLCRLSKLTKFTCSCCTLDKSSKLVAFNVENDDEHLCNGCYGCLLSTEVEKTKG